MSKKLIHTEVLDNRMVKVYKDSEWQEYVCVLYEFLTQTVYGKQTQMWVKNEFASSHTDDKEDALYTAAFMVKPLPILAEAF